MKEMTSVDWFVTGDRDESRDHSLQLSSLLQSKGIPCEVEEKPWEGHWYPAEFHKSLIRGLAFILGGTGDAG
jgi:acetyl esterase/lipase